VNVDSTNRWLTLVANVGVIVGLIFLALEIRQNTEVARSAVDLEIAAMGTDFHMRVAENPALARAYYIGMRDPDSLTEDERIQLNYLIPGVFLLMEGAHKQFIRGFLPEEGWTPYEGLISHLLENPIVRDWWINSSTVFSQEFETVVENLSGVNRALN
jgi:hypothetical protein